MQSIAGGAAARPFVTHHNALDIDLFLRIALELHLKRLLVGGMERVFEIGRVYRNEGLSPRHNPEFTMMEAYQAYGDYHVMMDLTESLICGAIEAIGGGFVRPWGESTIDFTPPWPRRTYAELLARIRGRSIPADFAAVKAQGRVVRHRDGGQRPRRRHQRAVRSGRRGPPDRADLRHRLSGRDLPADQAQGVEPAVAERFELYVHGIELANAYTELNDPASGRAVPQAARRAAGGGVDGQDGRRLRPGTQARMPPAGGLGIGIDRLCMILLNRPSIRDVILFPLMRPQSGGTTA